MATWYAKSAGNWDKTDNWNSLATGLGTNGIPAAGDTCESNNFAIVINVNPVGAGSSLAAIKNTAGGNYTLSNGVTLRCDLCQSVAAALIAMSAGSATIIGAIEGGASASTNRYGVNFTSTGTLTVQGNVTGGAASNTGCHGIYHNTATGTVNITGNVQGGSGTSLSYGVAVILTGYLNVVGNVRTGTTAVLSHGILNTVAGTITVSGSIYAGTHASGATCGIYNTTTGPITVTNGNVYGGTGGTAAQNGIHNAGIAAIHITGDVISGRGSAASHGVLNAVAGSVTIVGNIYGGNQAAGASCGVYNTTTGVITTSGGNIYGGSGGTAAQNGIHNAGAATLNITGNVYGGTGTTISHGIINAVGGAVNITGSVYGGTGSAASTGVYSTTTGTVTVSGDVKGGSSSTAAAHGIHMNGAGTVTVSGTIIGGDSGPGGVAAVYHAGVHSASTGVIRAKSLKFGIYGANPTTGFVWASDDTTSTCDLKIYGDNSTFRTLTNPATTSGLPAVGNVRYGTSYAAGTLTGTLRVPAASSVAYGALVDNTSGTAVLTTADVENAVWNSLLTSHTTLGTYGHTVTNMNRHVNASKFSIESGTKSASSATYTYGSDSTNTYAATVDGDNSYHVIITQTDLGMTEVIDMYYEFNVGTTGTATLVGYRGIIETQNDPVNLSPMVVSAYNWVTSQWTVIGSINPNSLNMTVALVDDIYATYNLTSHHTGTAANDGLVRIKFYVASSNGYVLLKVNQLFVAYEEAASAGGVTAQEVWEYTGGTGRTVSLLDDSIKASTYDESTAFPITKADTSTTELSRLTAANVKSEADAALLAVGLTSTVTGHINADITSRMETFTYTAPDNATITAINNKTTNLPSDPADQSAIEAAITAAHAITDGYIDTEVGAIKGVVDSILLQTGTNGVVVAPGSKTGYELIAAYDPAKTAAQAGNAMTLTAAYDAAKTAAQAGNAMTLTAAYDSAKTAAQVGSAMTLADSAITASKYDNTTAFPVAQVDNGTTAISRLTAANVKAEADAALLAVGVTSTVTGHINADITSRMATFTYTAPDNTTIGLIHAKTTNLPSDPADESAVEAAISAAHVTTDGKIDAVAGYVDTEVGAIKGVVDSILLQTGTNGVVVASGSKTGYSLVSAYDPAKTAAQAGNAMTLTAAYDLAKTAAQPGAEMALTSGTISSIQSGLATAVDATSIDDKVDTIISYVDSEIGDIKTVTDKLDTTLVVDGGVYQFTANALELGPAGTGEGGGATAQQIWEYATRTITSIGTNGVTGGSLDATAISKIQGGLATAVDATSIDDKIDSVISYIDTEVGDIKTVTDKLNTTLVADGGVHQFTANALELAPVGGGSGATPQQIWEYTTRTVDIASINGSATAATALKDNIVYLNAPISDVVSNVKSSTMTSDSITVLANSVSIPHGTQIAGDYTYTYINNGSYWNVRSASNEIEIVLEFNVGSDKIATRATLHGRYEEAGAAYDNTINTYVWNWVNGNYDLIVPANGAITHSTTDQVKVLNINTEHTGTGGDLGTIRIKISGAALDDNSNLYIDSIGVQCISSVTASSVWNNTARVITGSPTDLTVAAINTKTAKLQFTADNKVIAEGVAGTGTGSTEYMTLMSGIVTLIHEYL